MTKNQYRIQLSHLCSEKGISLPADFGSLTIAGLKERIALVGAMVTEPCIPTPPEGQEQSETSSKKARNAQEFAVRYASFVQRLRQNRSDKQAAAAVIAAPRFLAKLTRCTITSQGEHLFIHNNGRKIPLEETNLQW